jgi:hypothetical protein
VTVHRNKAKDISETQKIPPPKQKCAVGKKIPTFSNFKTDHYTTTNHQKTVIIIASRSRKASILDDTQIIFYPKRQKSKIIANIFGAVLTGFLGKLRTNFKKFSIKMIFLWIFSQENDKISKEGTRT